MEIASKLDYHVNTIAQDRKVIIQQFFENTQQDLSFWLQEEVGRLQTARNSALACFYEDQNRHGEGHFTGYMTAYAKLTEMLHELLWLKDPQAAHMVGKQDTDIIVLDIQVGTPEQAKAVMSGKITFEDLQEMVTA